MLDELNEIKDDIYMWIYAFYIICIIACFTNYLDTKRKYYISNNLRPSEDVLDYLNVEDTFYLVLFIISYVFIIPSLYFNRCGGTYESLMFVLFFWIGRFFDLVFLILFFWESFLFTILSSFFVILIITAYSVLFFPLLSFIVCFVKFLFFFVQLYNKSLIFDTVMKLKFVIYFFFLLSSLIVFLYPNFYSFYSSYIFYNILVFLSGIWFSFLPS